METNETILTKQVVSLDDCRQVGQVKGTLIDGAARGVSHYLVNAENNVTYVLPIESALSVGDTFMIVQSTADLLAQNEPAVRHELEDKFDIVGLDVFSVSGNKLGSVSGYEIDTIYGDVVSLSLDDGNQYVSEEFTFFSPEFIFVNDGAKTDAELRGVAARANRGTRGVTAPLA